LNLDARISWHRLNDLIANRLVRDFPGDLVDGRARFFENRFDYTYNSAEFQIDLKPTPFLRLRASYAYAFGQDTVLENRQLIPRHTLSLFGSDVRALSNRDRLDVRLAREFQFGKLNASIAVQAELELTDNVDYLERNEVSDQYSARFTLQLP